MWVRAIIFGCCCVFPSLAVASMAPWSPLLRALLAGGVTALMTATMLRFNPPGGGKGLLKGQEGAPHNDNPH